MTAVGAPMASTMTAVGAPAGGAASTMTAVGAPAGKAVVLGSTLRKNGRAVANSVGQQCLVLVGDSVCNTSSTSIL